MKSQAFDEEFHLFTTNIFKVPKIVVRKWPLKSKFSSNAQKIAYMSSSTIDRSVSQQYQFRGAQSLLQNNFASKDM